MKYFFRKLNFWLVSIIIFASCTNDISNDSYTIKYYDMQFDKDKGVMYVELELINKTGAIYPPRFWDSELETIPGHQIFRPIDVIHSLILEDENTGEIKDIYRLKFKTISFEFNLSIPKFPVMHVNLN